MLIILSYTTSMQNSTLIKLAKTADVRGYERLNWLYEPLVFIYAVVSLLVVSAVLALPVVFYVMATEGVENAIEIVESPPTPGLAFASLFSSFIGIYFAVWLWLYLIERRPFTTIGLQAKQAVWRYVRGLLIGVGFICLVVGILALFGWVDWERTFAGFSASLLSGVGLLFAGFVIQGAAEEVLVRGFLLPIFARRYNLWVSIVVTSLIFAVLHLLNPNLSPIAVLNLFLAGIIFALYALKEGSIWGACGLHTTWNWTMGHVFGFEVSGGSFGGPGSILFDLMETGPDWMTGGLFGLEGGVIVTLVLILGSIAIYLSPTNTADEASPNVA